MGFQARLRRQLGLGVFAAGLVVGAPAAQAYSVLTHEMIVDAVWDTDLKPLLHARFRQASEEDLRKAHAYAYGGCLIQDMGYYPFGSKLFTDLAHYVRSGDFVEALLREAGDVNEYAFALGALAHYVSDNVGHPDATNRVVPLLYPKLAKEFGNRVTYAEDPAAHLKTEFGFDVAEVAHGQFAPKAYHDFVGFEVAKPVLQRAFEETYGVRMTDLFTSLDLAIGSYRRAVSTIIPNMTKVAWEAKKDQIVAAAPGMTREKFVQTVSRAAYEQEWGTQYERPGVLHKVLAFLFRLIPRIGPFKALAFRAPTPEAERMYLESVNRTVSMYRQMLRRVREGGLRLDDRDLDTGGPTRAGDYPLADRAFADLLHRLAKKDFEGISPRLRARILAFYQDAGRPVATKKDARAWKRTSKEIKELEAATPTRTPPS